MPVKGAKRAVDRIRALANVEQAIAPVLFHAGELLATEAQISITRGAVSGRNHIPSSPGEPPNQDTGVLAGNIEVTQESPLLVRVTSKADYSAALEFGTSKMEARPFMRPARDKTQAQGKALIAAAVQKFVKGAR